MNKQRRDTIGKLLAVLEPLEDDLANLESDEADAFGNLSEGLQQSERGQVSEAAANALANAKSSYDDLVNSLNEAME